MNGALFVFKLCVCVCVGSQSDTQSNVSKGELLPGKKTFYGRSDSSRIIVGQFIRYSCGHFSVKKTIFKRNKNCAARKNTVNVKGASRKVTILQLRGKHMGKRR
jgi:hypothetical protein